MQKNIKTIIFFFLFSCSLSFGMIRQDSVVDTLLKDNLIKIADVPSFRAHIIENLHHIASNKIGRLLLEEIRDNSTSESFIIIEPIDLSDDSEEASLGPQSYKEGDIVYVKLYDRSIKDGEDAFICAFKKSPFYGFYVNPRKNCEICDDAKCLVPIDVELQHITLLHELNHARIFLQQNKLMCNHLCKIHEKQVKADVVFVDVNDDEDSKIKVLF